MNARLATADDRILAGTATAGTNHDQATKPHDPRVQPQEGAIQFESGYLSPHFVNHPERMEVAFENVYILIHEGKISSKKDLLPLLAQIIKSGKPLLIIAEDVGDEALAALVVSKLRGPLQVAAVRTPGIGDQRKSMLQEIARLTGGKAIGDGIGLQMKNIEISDLGQASRISIDKNNTLVEYRVRNNNSPFSLQPPLQNVGFESRGDDTQQRATDKGSNNNVQHCAR
jgi:chaperonin GroEL (HSP60 family)